MSFWYAFEITRIHEHDRSIEETEKAYTRVNIALYDIPYYLFQVVLYSLLFSWVHLFFNLKVLLEEYENPN